MIQELISLLDINKKFDYAYDFSKQFGLSYNDNKYIKN